MTRHTLFGRAAYAAAFLAVSAVGAGLYFQPPAAKPVVGLLAAPAPQPSAGDIQAALDQGGTVTVPAGVYELSEPLRLTLPGTTLIGAGQGQTRFLSLREDGLPAVEVAEGCWGFRLEGFSVERPGGITDRNYAAPGYDPKAEFPEYADAGRLDRIEKGETVGVGFGVRKLSGEKGSGTVCGNGVCRSIGVSGFHYGWKVGDDTNATCGSEIHWEHCGAYYARDGFHFCGGGNALNFRITNLNVFRCWNGVRVRSGGQVQVVGGASAFVGYYLSQWESGAVFRPEWAGSFSIQDFRAETSARLVYCPVAESVVNLSVLRCETTGGIPFLVPKDEQAAVWVQGNCNLIADGNRCDQTGLVMFFARNEPGMTHGQVSARNNAVGGFGPLRAWGPGEVRRIVELNQRLTPVGTTAGRWPQSVKR